jgi:hypothetical protein
VQSGLLNRWRLHCPRCGKLDEILLEDQ